MPEADPLKIMTFETPQDLGVWLSVNHSTQSELWVKIFKKHTKIPSVTWNDVVIEVLCWGWIDGVKSIDDKVKGTAIKFNSCLFFSFKKGTHTFLSLKKQ